MPEKNEKQKKEAQAEQANPLYGQQGNTGLYGQGQYDSEGKPDTSTPQGKEIHSDDPKKLAKEQEQNTQKASIPQD
ncbi:hypothetical protein ccbrp13_48200 [Ktedonobacteria bacterium brp13]|nr:hypothetical protein ccbrp13_48200 [Ktedonobacteria bacterium brp13]